jgi:probable F420-dependent oxidoreductase
MDFGLHVGTRGVGADPENLARIARHAEGLGFAYLAIPDHIVIAEQVDSRYPYNESGNWPAADTGTCLEQVGTLIYLAGVTERIRLLTSVMVLPYREPILAAKLLATADVLSKGRLTVGVGVGWMAEEMALLRSPPFAERGAASNEYIEAFRALWTEARPSYKGRHVAFERVLFDPKPVQKPHPPLWVGGETAPARRRAGRLGDGWYPVGANPRAWLDTPELFAAGLVEVQGHAEAAGRDPAALDVGLYANWYKLGAAQPGREGGRRAFTGPADAILEDIAAYAGVGVRHLVIGFESNELTHALDEIERFATAVMAKAR